MNRKFKASSIEKKFELEKLKSQVARAQSKIKKLQAKVGKLTLKLDDSTLVANNANANKASATDNFIFVEQVIGGIEETVKKVDRVIESTQSANSGINYTAGEISKLINNLVYSVELIDALALAINKQKAANELIPDDLVTAITTASGDANEAVALCLTAMQSCNLAMTTSKQADGITSLEYQQSLMLYGLITGKEVKVCEYINSLDQNDKTYQNGELNQHYGYQDYDELFNQSPKEDNNSLYALLKKAQEQTAAQADQASKAKQQVEKALLAAKGELDREIVELDALEAGLAAATAATLAA